MASILDFLSNINAEFGQVACKMKSQPLSGLALFVYQLGSQSADLLLPTVGTASEQATIQVSDFVIGHAITPHQADLGN